MLWYYYNFDSEYMLCINKYIKRTIILIMTIFFPVGIVLKAKVTYLFDQWFIIVILLSLLGCVYGSKITYKIELLIYRILYRYTYNYLDRNDKEQFN